MGQKQHACYPSSAPTTVAQWVDIVKGVLGGYCAAEEHQRYALLLDFPRTFLSLPVREHRRSTGADESLQRRLRQLLSLNAVGKAARTAFGRATPATISAEVTQRLRDLRLLEPTETAPTGTTPRRLVNISAGAIHYAVKKKMARGACPGLDGWTRELLVPIVESQPLLHELTEFVADMLCARCSDTFMERTTSARLIPLQQGEKIRPIAPESAMVKLACLVGQMLIPKAFFESLRPLQQGVGGSVEETCMEVRNALRSAGYGILVDCRNAFNSIHRHQILAEALRRPELLPLHGVIQWTLRRSSLYLFGEDGQVTDVLSSTRGVRQGSVLGPLLFAVAIQPVLTKLAELFPQVKAIAYLDDISLIGPPDTVNVAWRHLAAELKKIGLEVNPAKSLVIVDPKIHPTAHGAPEGVPVSSAGVVRVLGSGYGVQGESCAQFVADIARSHSGLFTTLLSLEGWVALRLLTACAVPRMNFAIRTHRPEDVAEGANIFDAFVKSALEDIAGTKLSERAIAIARLPCSLGGLGLRSCAELGRFASSCVGEKQRQRTLTAQLDVGNRDALIDSLSGAELSFLTSASQKGAARVLTDPQTVLSDRALAVWLRLRLLEPVLELGAKCACGEPATNAHLLTCVRMGGNPKIGRHNQVVLELEAAFRECGHATQREVSLSLGNRTRPDLLTVTVEGSYVTDVTVTCPAQVTVHSANPLAAAKRAGAQKTEKWAQWAEHHGMDFAPFVFETTGAVLPESVQWLKRVLRCSDHVLSIRTTLQHVLARATTALHRQQLSFFCGADKALRVRRRLDTPRG